MAETSHCLNSYPKFFCNVITSILSLQAHSIWQTSIKQEIWKTVLHILAVCQYFLLHPSEYGADSSMKQEPWRTVPPCFGKFSSHFPVGPACPMSCIQSSSPGKSSFLPTLKTNSIRSFSDAHHPLEVTGVRSRHLSLSRKVLVLKTF